MAILVVNLVTTRASIGDWVDKLLLERTAAAKLQELWKPSNAWPASSRGSRAWEYVQLAMGLRYSDDELDRIGLAIEVWPHAGQADGLRHSQLRQFIRQDKKQAPMGVRPNKRAVAPLRWRTWQVCYDRVSVGGALGLGLG